MRLHDLFEWVAREQGDLDFVVHGARRVSYGAADREVNRLANAIGEAGLGPGDRFAVLAKNSFELVAAYLAGSKSGTVPVPLNYRLAPAEWHYLLSDSSARLVIARGDHLVESIDTIRAALPEVRAWVSVEAPTRAAWVDYGDWVGARSDRPPADRGESWDHDLCQMYTSGTTGRPKGAILTHRSVFANLLQCQHAIPVPYTRGDRSLVVMPIFHAGAASQVFGAVSGLATMVLHEDFDPQAVVTALSEDRIVMTSLVPAMIRACLDRVPDVRTRRYDTLRALFYGASPIDEVTLRRALEVFRCDVYQAYGMTEASVVLTILSAEDHRRALAGKPELLRSAGRAIAGTEIRVVDLDGNPVPAGEPGQVIARGPQLMKGYWERPEATAATLDGGWLHTGDVGALDGEGYLYLQDRLNDMIVSGGENIYPREIEEVLFEHEGVADAAVIGIPDERFGEAVLAFVVTRPGALVDAEELRCRCRAKIGGFKVPRRIEFLDSLPRNATGKVLRRELREPFWKGRDRRIG